MIYIYRPLKPCFHLAMVLTLLAQHQPVVSEIFLNDASYLTIRFWEQRKLDWPLPSLFSLVFQEEILSYSPLVCVKHHRADLARPHGFAEFEFHHPGQWASKFGSSSKRRYEYKLQWVVSGRGAEVLAMTCVFCWCCLPHLPFLHHSHPAITVLKTVVMQNIIVHFHWNTQPYIHVINETILNWMGMRNGL